MSSPKYNRTPHLPWSAGRGADDKVAVSVDSLLGKHIVITEKMDRSNTSLEKDGCFARTHSGPPTHASFDGLKALHARTKYQISEGVQYFGEWCYAKHSILYSTLPSYFLLFGVRFNDDGDGAYWRSWDYVIEASCDLGVYTVPTLWVGQVKTAKELEVLTKDLAAEKSCWGEEREGVVVRISEGFNDADFSTSVMKYVRKNHVQTTEHWKDQEIIKNGLRARGNGF